MFVVGLDTETTDVEFGENGRLIEVCLSTYKYEGEKLTFYESHTWRIDPKCSMNPKAQAVHGISLAELIEEPEFADVAEEIAKVLSIADVIVAHNAAFDCKFMGKQFEHFGIELLKKPMHVFCTMLLGRWATALGTVPSLEALCFACDVDYDASEAHSAIYDVNVMMRCLDFGLKHGFYKLTDAQTLTRLQDFNEQKHLGG